MRIERPGKLEAMEIPKMTLERKGMISAWIMVYDLEIKEKLIKF